MRLLLDTHVLLALAELGSVTLPPVMIDAVTAPDAELLVSVASVWETAIKVRSGKLLIGFPLTDLPDVCAAASASLLDIRARHVLAELRPDPPTRDPFDRLLLAQAQLEGCQLVTLDRMLADHPLAWRP